MHTKTELRYHLTLVRMAIIEKSINNKCCRGCGEKGILLHFWWKCKLIQSLWRTVWRFVLKLGVNLTHDTPTPLQGIHPEKTIIQTHVPRCSLQCLSINEQIKKLWYYSGVVVLLSHKNEQN